MFAAVFVGAQVPAVIGLAALAGSWPLALAAAALLSAPYLPHLANPWRDPDPRPVVRAALLVYYAWFATGLGGWLFGPLAVLATWTGALPAREALLAACLLSLAAGARALWPHPRLVRRTIRVAGLPRAFDGYRIAHLSDVHCGPWTPAARVRRWVRRMNALHPDLVAVTGDLITAGNAYVGAVSTALGELRARDGVFACMGNHDYLTDGEAFACALESAGLTVLRNRGRVVQRGDDRLYVAGADDTWTGRDDVERALADRPPGAPAVLLAHDPTLFGEAAAHGVDLVLSGHTHGGQVAVPGAARRLNLARLVTPFTMGIYRRGACTLYVSRGAGTTGPPVRLGAPSEITLLTLRAA